MSDNLHDINDDEIRIISSNSLPTFQASFGNYDGDDNDRSDNRKKRVGCIIVIAVLLFIFAGLMILFLSPETDDTTLEIKPAPATVTTAAPATEEPTDTVATVPALLPYVTVRDTVVNGHGLCILTPVNATPTLVIGEEALNDSTAVLVAQAADVRADNRQIAGAFVMEGELKSRGEAKAGFCAIINGEIKIGVADATPMFEQAIESNGYFFRQFPLVVGSQVVENKPRGRSLRKALADIDGRMCVILSRERLTFHNFSQALIDIGARNAIYLVGSNAAGFYVDDEGTRYIFGTVSREPYPMVNYIVWR